MSGFDANATAYHPFNAWVLSSLSLSAYREEARWEADLAALDFVRHASLLGEVTQAFVARGQGAVVIAFRGTEFDDPRDVIADMKVRLVPGPFGRVHRGIAEALDEVWEGVLDAATAASQGGEILWLTGHSMGAGLALLAAARLASEGLKPRGLQVYGAPRVGDEDFARGFSRHLGSMTVRHVNDNDVVARLPPEDMGYRHVGSLVYYERDGGRRYDEPSYSRLEAIRDRFERAKEGPPDGMKDHLVPRYEELTRRWREG